MKKRSNQEGFSVAELIIVVVILAIFSSLAMMTLSSTKKYAADDQAKRIVDFFDEARQKALNQRTTFRVEINKTKKQLLLIDENESDKATDDKIVTRTQISNDVLIGVKPASVAAGPTTTSPAPAPAFVSSGYPLSNGDEKITLRFKKNGQVVDVGTDEIDKGSLMTGATIYVHSNKPNANNPDIVRAVVLLGTTADTSIFKCTYTSPTVCGNWKK
jgi:prepilin-type N-terminal cleavage/methylation domain-containing protein